MKHKLLVAVSCDETSLKAVTYAARACAGTDPLFPGIVLLHVFVPIPPFAEGADPVAADKLADRLDQQRTDDAEKCLAGVKEDMVREGVPSEKITTELAEAQGDVMKQIVRAAAAHHCDTIVVGRNHRSQLGEFLAGGVVEHIMRKPTGYTVWLVE